MAPATPKGWSSAARRNDTGAVFFQQSARPSRPAVSLSETGARELAEMIERIAAERRRRPFTVEVPVPTPRLSSYWFHLVTPVGADVARPLIEGLRTPTVVHEDRIRQFLPIELTPFGTAVRQALAERPPAFR